MEVYHKLLKLLVQANIACPILDGKIFKYNKGSAKLIEIFPGRKAKLRVLLRCFILIAVSCSMVIRILYLKLNKTNGNLNPTEKVYLNLCVLTFFICVLISERYRGRCCFPENFPAIVNSLYVMEARYFRGI